MELIADTLMVAGSFGAAIYCYVLAARLKRFTTLETGMGGAIAVLSAQVDDMTVALEQARGAANGSASSLEVLTARGEAVAKRLELLVAALHDLPEAAAPPPPRPVATFAEQPMTEADRRLRFVRRRVQRDALEAAE
jgi:5'-deoxynucleotidase YfbR-like HD superfamily hydrolase